MYITNLLSPAPMHIPDGFLSVIVSVLLWIVSIAAVAYALKRVNQDLGERQVPLMGVLAAAIFAGQMLNFTVAGGTSGHLMGAAIATILLGPWAAVLVMTTVVGVQALVFQDGGLLALGANIFNMAVVGVAVSYFVYQTVYRLSRGQRWGIFVGGFLAAWTSIVVAALATGLELAISGTSPANLAIPAMGGIHAIIGIGEGLITLGAVGLHLRNQARPAWSGPKTGYRRQNSMGGRAGDRRGIGNRLAAGFFSPGWAGMGCGAKRFPGYCPWAAVPDHPGLCTSGRHE